MTKQRKRGQLDALQGKPRYYGCHLGMRSTLSQDKEDYYQGWDEVNDYLTYGDRNKVPEGMKRPLGFYQV